MIVCLKDSNSINRHLLIWNGSYFCLCYTNKSIYTERLSNLFKVTELLMNWGGVQTQVIELQIPVLTFIQYCLRRKAMHYGILLFRLGHNEEKLHPVKRSSHYQSPIVTISISTTSQKMMPHVKNEIVHAHRQHSFNFERKKNIL